MDTCDEFSCSSYSEQDDRTDSGLSSGSLSNGLNRTGPEGNEEHDAMMKEIVRRENRAVMCLRLVVMFVLLTAGAVAATVIYLSTSYLEQKAFDDEFESVSINTLRSFKNDIQLKFFMAQTVSAAIVGAMEQSGGDKTNTTVAQFHRIVHSQRFLERVRAVYWSPYLKTTEEKNKFEQFVNGTASLDQNSAFPVCFFCGSPNTEFANKNGVIEGLGQSFTCKAVEAAAESGAISAADCEEGRDYAVTACGCKMREGSQDIFTGIDRTIADGLFVMDGLAARDDQSEPPYHPIWQVVGTEEMVKSTMYNQQSEERRANALDFLVKSKLPVISETFVPDGDPFYRAYGRVSRKLSSILFFPILDENGPDGEVIGSVAYEFDWELFIVSVPPPGSEYVDVVIQNSCDQTYTYQVQTLQDSSERSILSLVATGDAHDRTYSHMGRYRTYEDYDIDRNWASTGDPYYEEHPDDACRYRFAVYPTHEMESRHKTHTPIILAVSAGAIMAFACVMFLLYDRLVTVRQRKVMRTARRTNAIVSSLFPENIRNRLFDADGGGVGRSNDGQGFPFPVSAGPEDYSSDPIADLFPATTIIFMDISGFTAWASEREPAQVFKLLESVYNQFDGVANKSGVFKVETVGDSYVAAAGLPDPRPDHAVVMAKFAFVCMKKFHTIVRRLEVQLGPSTGELDIRCGLHSGPVTAGVLRGDKARFQLFGTTMNTASRMESTGVPGKIQISEDTAKLLREADKEQWLVTRPDKVEAKGLGTLTTYFLEQSRYGRERHPPVAGSVVITEVSTIPSERTRQEDDSSNNAHDEDTFWETQTTKRNMSRSEMAKYTRLVDWNTELLGNLLTNILAHRKAKGGPLFGAKGQGQEQTQPEVASSDLQPSDTSKLVIDQVADIIPMPEFDPELASKLEHSRHMVTLDSKVRDELREFVFSVASLYRDNPFHNFDHASHVTMSASKLLRRIVSPSVAPDAESLPSLEKLHRDTYGISSDPIMQFTVVLATIIHDLDHTGLSNQELVHLQTPAALSYDNRSVAEQNSLDIAWALLTDTSEFQNLRRAIYTTPEECGRFRQILVNAVIATDIADKDLQKRRKERWTRAFSPDEEHDPSRKATIVMDYILQASDIAHTMQHFLTYTKWNARLFEERYRAWKIGREPDPREGWYKGEIGFFDFYIIPVAMKLKECGVFGVSHDEYLNYAQANRLEWEKRGQDIVKKLIEKEECKYQLKSRKAGVGSE